MTTAPRRLTAVSGKERTTGRCSVACQATLSGAQEVTVRVLTPVSGSGNPQLGIRLGQVLLLLSDLEALTSVLDACSRAEHLGEAAFGCRV